MTKAHIENKKMQKREPAFESIFNKKWDKNWVIIKRSVIVNNFILCANIEYLSTANAIYKLINNNLTTLNTQHITEFEEQHIMSRQQHYKLLDTSHN